MYVDIVILYTVCAAPSVGVLTRTVYFCLGQGSLRLVGWDSFWCFVSAIAFTRPKEGEAGLQLAGRVRSPSLTHGPLVYCRGELRQARWSQASPLRTEGAIWKVSGWQSKVLHWHAELNFVEHQASPEPQPQAK